MVNGFYFGVTEFVVDKANGFIMINSISELSNGVEFLKDFFSSYSVR